MLRMITLDVLVPRIAAEATRRLRMSSVMPTSRGRSFASHGPLCYLRSPWSSGRPETAAVGSAWSISTRGVGAEENGLRSLPDWLLSGASGEQEGSETSGVESMHGQFR